MQSGYVGCLLDELHARLSHGASSRSRCSRRTVKGWSRSVEPAISSASKCDQNGGAFECDPWRLIASAAEPNLKRREIDATVVVADDDLTVDQRAYRSTPARVTRRTPLRWSS
jgi:hypothetical protein